MGVFVGDDAGRICQLSRVADAVEVVEDRGVVAVLADQVRVGLRNISELGLQRAEVIEFPQEIVAVVDEPGDFGAVVGFDLEAVGVISIGRNAKVGMLDLD